MERIRIPDYEFSERVKKIQALMKERGVDLMFAVGNEAEPHFVRYLSDYWPSFESGAVVFAQKGDPILLIGPEALTYAADRSRIKDIRRVKCLRETSDPEYPGETLEKLEDIFSELIDGKLETVGIAGYNLITKLIYDDVAEAAKKLSDGKAKIISADRLVMEVRKIKSENEIACLREAGRITHAAMRFMIENIKPGMTEQQATGLGSRAAYENGSEADGYVHFVLAGLGSDQAMSRSRAKVIQKEDFVYMSVGARYEGYTCSIGRPMFFGKPDETLLYGTKMAIEAQALIKEQLFDKNNASEVARVYYDHFTKAGLRENLLYGPCHASGLMEGEIPWIESDSDFLLHENMCFCTDVFLRYKNGYGLRIEDSMRVGKTCGDDYTNFPRDIVIKNW